MLFAFLAAYLIASVLSTIQLTTRSGSEAFQGWLRNLTQNPVTDLGANNFYAAIGLFLAGGLLWAVLYAAWFEPILPGPAWQRGMLYALLPGLLSQAVVMPLVGGGVAGFALGAGPLPAVGALLLHLVYGALLGVVYGPLGNTDADTLLPPEVASYRYSSNFRMAIGIIGGALVGALVGLAISLLQPFRLDLVPAEAMLGSALLLSALGALIGSFADLTPPRDATLPVERRGR
jgi:hypothetical protein